MDFVRPVEAVIPGTQGRVLAVLAETTAELNLRTVARLASVSPAQASRVLPGLVELGLVDRREADRHSDVDAVIVRPDDIDAEDDAWTAGVELWSDAVRAITGNAVEIVEANQTEATKKLASKRSLWRDVARDGVVVHGTTLDQFVK